MAPDELTIRPQRAADASAVREVVARAFDDARVADLAEALRDSAAARASLVAEVGGRVVGHVQLSRGWLDAPDRLLEVLVLSPLSVEADHRRRGVGAGLVRQAVDEAGRSGAPLLFLEGSPRYYGRLGFTAAGPFGFTRPSVRIPEAAFQVVRLPGYEPWMSGALVYPDPFWAYDCVGLREPRPA